MSETNKDRGAAIHAFLLRACSIGRAAALATVPEEHRAACAVLDVEELPRVETDIEKIRASARRFGERRARAKAKGGAK